MSFPTDFLPALSRNKDLLSAKEQAALQAATVLVAGCGSVGGAVVEPLVRLGAASLILADPDVYDATNLNRQACQLDDLGQSKVSVLAKRAKAINRDIYVRTREDGVTVGNVNELLSRATIVFDGIDPEQAPWEKYLLHQQAAQGQIPVVAGGDFGGKPTLYVFDYRVDSRPFYGKTTARAHRNGQLREAMRWLGYFHFPRDFLPIMRDRMQTGEPWPQIVYCVAGMGALGSRLIVDLAVSRSVRSVVSIDIHQAVRPRREKVLDIARLPFEIVRTAAVAQRRVQSGRPSSNGGTSVSSLPEDLATVVQACRLAPSPHNSQPWQLKLTGDNENLELGWDQTRWLPAADPLRRGATYALGCALESMNYVARGEWQPSGRDDLESPDWLAGKFRLAGLLEDSRSYRTGVLQFRSTNRGEYVRRPLSSSMLSYAHEVADDLDVAVHVTSDRATISAVAIANYEATRQLLDSNEYVAELWSWLRLHKAEVTRAVDGFLPASLGLNAVARRVFATLKGRPDLRRYALQHGLAHAIARDTERLITASGSLITILYKDDSVEGRLRAGQAIMRVWLRLTEAGYALHPQHASILDDTEMAVTRSAMGIAPDCLIASVIRAGHAHPARRGAANSTPRLPTTAVLRKEL